MLDLIKSCCHFAHDAYIINASTEESGSKVRRTSVVTYQKDRIVDLKVDIIYSSDADLLPRVTRNEYKALRTYIP
jgi:hypothetical protein